jgi:DNA-binding transcriptional LysR family regulator
MNLESVRIFAKLAELGSFTQTAKQLGMGKSRVSALLKALEAQLGTRLLQRTTRAVRLTPDGEQFLVRASVLVEEADDLFAMFQKASSLRGRVRIDLPIGLARNFVIPKLPEFLAQHPSIDLVVSATDQRVDVVADGFDCVLRVGTLVDSGLIARRLGSLSMLNCASPSYLRKYGTPRNLADLAHHYVVDYSLSLGAEDPGFEYRRGSRWLTLPMRSFVTVNNTDAYQAACVAGLGIIQAPRTGLEPLIRSGQLVSVLPDLGCKPMPVSIVHSRSRHIPGRVREVMNFLEQALKPAFEQSSHPETSRATKS